MDRRVLGSGAIVCSAIVLWSQPSTPESQEVQDCQDGAAICTERAAQNVQPQPRILPPDVSRAIEALPIEWGSGAADLPESMESLYGGMLERAQAAASENKLAIALTTVAGIPNNSEHRKEATQLQESWAQELLERGNSRYQQGNVEAAMAMLSAIPPTSDRFERAQELMERWNRQAALLNRAEVAKNAGDWQSVMVAIESLEGSPLYDSRPVQQLLQQALYRAYGSDESLMQLAELPAGDVGGAAIAAIPTDQVVPEGVQPNLPDLPIDVNQAMAWAQPISPSAAAPRPTPVPVPIAPPTAIAQSLEVAEAAAMPSVPVALGSIAPPELITATIDKSEGDRSSSSLSGTGMQLEPKLAK